MSATPIPFGAAVTLPQAGLVRTGTDRLRVASRRPFRTVGWSLLKEYHVAGGAVGIRASIRIVGYRQ